MTDATSTIEYLLKKYRLDNKVKATIRQAVVDKKFFTIQVLFLDAIDHAWFNGKVTDDEAKIDYHLVGLSREMACKIRQEQEDEIWWTNCPKR